jgi:alpha/beta hydrolase family protein
MGRTADIDRKVTPAALASDIIGLLDELGIERAHVFGHSMGAAVILELGVNYPSRVRSLVGASASVRPEGCTKTSLTRPGTRRPCGCRLSRTSLIFTTRISDCPRIRNVSPTSLRQCRNRTRTLVVGPTTSWPTLLLPPFVLGDRDFTTVEHGALMLTLIPGSQLAVLPDTTHMQVTRRADLLLPMLARFLD